MKDSISIERVKLLHPKIRSDVQRLINKVEESVDSELSVRVVQGLRTISEQDALYAQGRTTAGNIVTKARGGRSFHNYGLAIDVCWLFDGKYDEKKSWLQGGNFAKLKEVFKNAGWEWGGDWKTIKDGPHFQNSFGYTWKQLWEKHNDKDFIIHTEYVNI